jgi:predicted nucleic acid-binding protein
VLTIDASVWVSAESPREPAHAASRALVDHIAAQSIPLFMPTLVLAEVAGAIRRSSGDPVLAVDYVTVLLAATGIRWVSLDETMATRAAALAAQQALRGADAVYAAVAAVNGCTLVSLDREHLTRLPPVVATLNPADALAQLLANP